MLEALILEPRSAFASALRDIGPSASAEVLVSERAPAQAATVLARTGLAEIAGRLKEKFALDLANGSRCSAARDLEWIGTGPRTWFVLCDGAEPPLLSTLEDALQETAAVIDQSSGYGILRISGPKARATLEKGIGIDLHPRVFHTGDAAITSCAHLNVILWQIDETPTYDIAVARSFASSFAHWLMHSAAEFGVKVA